MSIVIHSIETLTADDKTVQTVAIEMGGCFVVTCTGYEVLHPCSDRSDIAIEPGDTWASDEAAVAFAEQHADEHFKREVRP